MNITYDSNADAMYIYFAKGKKVTRTEEVRDDIVLDYSGKELIGIEVLYASKKLPQKNLKSLSLNFSSKILSA